MDYNLSTHPALSAGR